MTRLSVGELDALVLSTKEVGLQSYEFLDGDNALRARAKEQFITDESNPQLDYPLLDHVVISHKEAVLKNLEAAIDRTDGLSEEASNAYRGTVSYRRKEAGMLLVACEMNLPEINQDELVEATRNYQPLNEELFGVVDPDIIAGIAAEVSRVTAEKDYVGQAKDIHDEVVETFITPNVSDGVALPSLDPEARAYLEAKIQDHYGQEWKSVQRIREILTAEDRDAFEPRDMLQVFAGVISARGLQGVTAFIKNSKLLSWSQEDKGVSIGDARDPISKDEAMFGVAVHEVGVHGQRYVNGRDSTISILGNGLYTSADPGEGTDYLSFEEGIANLYQSIASGKEEAWTIANFAHTIALATAYDGRDFRGSFELGWKIRSLFAQKDGIPFDETVVKSKGLAYDSTLRVFRGTPMHRTAELDHPVTYNKDLAYLRGRVRAILYWNEHYGSDATFDLLLAGKFDPTNKRQLAIAHAATGHIYA